MNKKIKIIELLNKIANGEKLPKKIIFLNETLEYDIDCQDYKGCSKTASGAFFAYLFTNEPTQNFINGRVEILEDNTEEIEEYKGESFEQLGYEVGKMSIAIAKGLEKAIKEMRKDLNS